MINLLGEYDCKVDAKGRFMFPAGLKKQLGGDSDKGFVINRNLHQECLVLYPIAEWEKLSAKLGRLNRLIKKNDTFVRKVMGGATPVSLDGAGRLLVPKSLAEGASVSKEIKVVGSGGVIEIWSKSKHADVVGEQNDWEAIAEDVMSDIDFDVEG